MCAPVSDSDLLLVMCRRLLAAQKRRRNADGAGAGAGLPPLKLILMSATLNAEVFATYRRCLLEHEHADDGDVCDDGHDGGDACERARGVLIGTSSRQG
eukprot:COSAG01_NODE_10773_length_2083_cov_1.930444_1_plen_99_part_00